MLRPFLPPAHESTRLHAPDLPRAASPPFPVFPSAGWTYWELRNEWKNVGPGARGPRQDWRELPTPLFDVDTVEDFWVYYSRTPKIVEVFDDGRYGAKNIIEREESGGTVIRTGAKGYMLFRHGVEPESSFEVNGDRPTKNGYRTEVSCSESIGGGMEVHQGPER